MRSRLFLIAFIGLAAGAGLAVMSLPQVRGALTSAGAAKRSEGKALVGGPFQLTDQNGRTVTDRDFHGRFMLVYFGYTYCPDVCPAGLQVMAAALDQIGPKADRVVPVFISLDPDRDTPKQLGEYVKSFGPRFVGLTGSAEEIGKAAKAYRVYFKKVADQKSPENYTLDHTSIIYLMDDKGEFVSHFTHATNPDQLAAQLKKVL